MTLVGNPTAAVFYPGEDRLRRPAVPVGNARSISSAMSCSPSSRWRGPCDLSGLRRVGRDDRRHGLRVRRPGRLPVLQRDLPRRRGLAPAGFLAADRWLRGANRRALAGLAVVLAMQCLGGDIECAYVLGLFTAVYALWLTLGRPRRLAVMERLACRCWAGARWCSSWPRSAPHLEQCRGISPSAASWIGRSVQDRAFSSGWAGCCGGAARIAGGRSDVAWSGLLLAAFVGAMLASVQLVPIAELASQSFRASADNRMDIYGFSLEPYRLVEAIWPGFFGDRIPGEPALVARDPSQRRPRRSGRPRSTSAAWHVLLAPSAAASGGEDQPGEGRSRSWRLASLVLSFGRYGSPLWWARYVPRLASILGPHGPSGSFFFRSDDGFVRDAFGSPYWLLASLAPGFDAFRFPAKVTVFASFGFAALAGLAGTAISTRRMRG